MYNKSAVIVALIMLAAGVTAGISTVAMIGNSAQGQNQDKMPSFTSYNELASFLDYATGGSKDYYQFSGSPTGNLDSTQGAEIAPQSRDYSKTNVQVEGIDEGDIVKTDGTYIYKASSDSVAIIQAYPPGNMSVVAWINASDLAVYVNETSKKLEGYNVGVSISGLFIAPERLIVISTVYFWQEYYYGGGYRALSLAESSPMGGWTQSTEQTVLFIYDTKDIQEPALLEFFGMSGYPLTSRMQGDVIYSVSQLYVWKDEARGYEVPAVSEGAEASAVAISDIHYDPETKDPGYYLNILAVNLTELKSKSISVVAGWASTIYKSPESLYLTIEKWPATPAPVMERFPMAIEYEDEEIPVTTIYKVDVDGLSMHISEKGDVKGVLHNQFSMDEKDGYLRVATSSGLWQDRRNAVYVLDGNLSVIGAIEDIAVNETIQANRFVGDRLYLVTFRQVDPLFVIDLSVPTAPSILGELTIPGFSSYLHPVDEDHILGIGTEGSSAKISLFDVSDPAAPVEMSKYLVGNYSSTSAGWEHKAVMFDAGKELLVIPISTYDYDTWNTTSGFFVFRVSVDEGISLRGVIGHGNSSYYFSSDERALYIEDCLYTISGTVVKANLISDLTEVGELVYRQAADSYYVYSAGAGTVTMIE